MSLPPFDQLTCHFINLDQRPDRLTQIRKSWQYLGGDDDRLIRFPGIYTGSAKGCGLSHQAIVRAAKKRGDPWVVVFEDDVYFRQDFPERWDRIAAELNRGDKYPDLFLGGVSSCHGASRMLFPEIRQIRGFTGLFFVIYFQSSYDTVLSWKAGTGHLDQYLGSCSICKYVAIPFLCTTHSGLSDIRNHETHDQQLIESVEKQLTSLQQDQQYSHFILGK